jgi:hypothetical protein
MIHSLLSQLVFAVLVLTGAFAFLKGGQAERWGASLICLSWFAEYMLSFLLKGLVSPRIEELMLLGADAALAVGLLIIAMRFAKIWLGLAMFMQSGELALHGMAMGDWGLEFRNYIFINNALSLGIILLAAGATLTAWLQRSRGSRQGGMPLSTLSRPT